MSILRTIIRTKASVSLTLVRFAKPTTNAANRMPCYLREKYMSLSTHQDTCKKTISNHKINLTASLSLHLRSHTTCGSSIVRKQEYWLQFLPLSLPLI